MGTHPIFESDFDCLTENMKLISLLIALCSASRWSIVKQPESVGFSTSAKLDGQELLSIQSVITGQAPGQMMDTQVLQSFNAFKPVAKAVILIVPELDGAFMSGDVVAASIELNYPSDAKAVVDKDEQVTVLSANVNVGDRVKELVDALTLKHGDNFILTLVSHSSLGDEMSSRQILQTADSPFIYSTQPRHADFGIIFIIIAAFTIVMIFGLVFISYELINMGPGDNIAYSCRRRLPRKISKIAISHLYSPNNVKFF